MRWGGGGLQKTHRIGLWSRLRIERSLTRGQQAEKICSTALTRGEIRVRYNPIDNAISRALAVLDASGTRSLIAFSQPRPRFATLELFGGILPWIPWKASTKTPHYLILPSRQFHGRKMNITTICTTSRHRGTLYRVHPPVFVETRIRPANAKQEPYYHHPYSTNKTHQTRT